MLTPLTISRTHSTFISPSKETIYFQFYPHIGLLESFEWKQVYVLNKRQNGLMRGAATYLRHVIKKCEQSVMMPQYITDCPVVIAYLQGKKIKGWCFSYHCNYNFLKKNQLFFNVFVHSKYRRLGIGTELLNQLKRARPGIKLHFDYISNAEFFDSVTDK